MGMAHKERRNRERKDQLLSERDREKFLSALPELVEFARVQDSMVTKQTVEEFFEDMELTKEHFEQIYAYLMANGIQVQDVRSSRKDIQKYERIAEQYRVPAEKKAGGTGKAEKEPQKSPYLQMYLRELKQIPSCNEGEEIDLYERLLQGDKNAQNRLAEGKLHRVLEIVREYADDSLITEDLVQEGNMGLMTALSELLNAGVHEDCAGMIDDYIRQFIAFAADDQIHSRDQEERILAKINLVHEAAKALAEEMGRIATLEELVDYTKLSIDEIEDIINLSEGGIDVGSGDVRPDREEGMSGPITWDFR